MKSCEKVVLKVPDVQFNQQSGPRTSSDLVPIVSDIASGLLSDLSIKYLPIYVLALRVDLYTTCRTNLFM